MSSNYPPGVTGGEYEIAGADAEWDEERKCENGDCPQYDKVQMVTMQRYSFNQWWTCETCGMQHDEELEEPDYDPERDRIGDY